METFVNIGFAKISVAAEKIWVALNLGEEGEGGGGKGSFQLPPGPYAHGCCHLFLQSNSL